MRQISVGADGATWGLNTIGQIYSYDFGTQSWINVPGALAQISVGTNEYVWGLNSSGLIFRWDAVAQSWDNIPGALAQIDIGADGDVWGLNAAGQIYHFNSVLQSWNEIPGSLAHLSVGFDGAVWGLNAGGQIYRYNPATGGFDNVPGGLAQISVGADGDVWGVNAASHVYHFNRLTQGWDTTTGTLTQISVGSGGNVWGVSSSGAVSTFITQTQTWTSVPGNLAQIHAGNSGSVWGLNASGTIFALAPSVLPASGLQQVPGALAQISVAPDGNVWGLNASNQIWTFNPQTQGWTYVPGLLTQITVGAEGNVWGLNSSDQIWTFNPHSQSWTYVPGSLSQIGVGANGNVWGINGAGQIYRWKSQAGGWTYVPGGLSQISVGADGDVWGLNSSGQIYEFNSKTQNWTHFAGTLAKISVGSTGNVWGLDSTGAVWRLDPPAGSFTSAPGTLAGIAVAFDGSAWGLNSAGQILRFDAQSQNWLPVQGSTLSTVSAGNDAAVWGLHGTSGIYSLQSGSAAAPLSITTVSNSAPLPLTALYIETSGLNTASPVTVQFSDHLGFSVTEPPVRITSGGTLTVGTPLYVNSSNHIVAAGTVSLTLVQDGHSSAPVTVSIQNLPSVASYGLQPGDATHALLVFDAMLLAMRINQLQAFQNLPGNSVDTTAAQATLQTLLTATIEARHDVDKVIQNPSTVIQDVTLPNGLVVRFDSNTLDMMDRVNANFLTQTFVNLPITSTPAIRSDDSVKPRESANSLKQTIQFMETVLGAKETVEGAEEYTHAKDWIDRIGSTAQAASGSVELLIGTGAAQETAATQSFGVAAAVLQDARTIGDAFAQDAAFAVGWATGNEALKQVAVEAMKDAEAANGAALQDLVLALAGGPTLAETLGDASTVASFMKTIFETEGPNEKQADQAQIDVANETRNMPASESQDLAYVDGTVTVSNSTGIAAAQTGLYLSSNGINLSTLADPAGNYEFMVALGNSTFDYSSATLDAYDPITGDILSSSTVDLSGLNSSTPVQVPTMTGSCTDTDDDEDDPDCDATGGIRNGQNPRISLPPIAVNATRKPASAPK